MRFSALAQGRACKKATELRAALRVQTGFDANPSARPTTGDHSGVGDLTGRALVVEIGMDMTRFPDSAHLISWADLFPHERHIVEDCR